MSELLIALANLAPDLTVQLRVSSGLVLAGILAIWLWRGPSGRR